MSAQEFVPGMNDVFRLNAQGGTAAVLRWGSGRPTRRRDPQDRTPTAGDAKPVGGGDAATISACEPTLLELYRQDPVAVRMEISRLAHRARNDGIRACFARLFG